VDAATFAALVSVIGGLVSAPGVRISLLGGFSVAIDGVPVDDSEWRRRQAAALVKVLALEPSRSVHRERLIDALWPDLDLETAAPRLHKAAHYARRALRDPGSLVLAGDTVSLFPGVEVDVDAGVFESRAAAALAARDAEAAGAAADSYTGDLLPGDLYEPWAEVPRQRLRLMYLDALRLAERWRDLAVAEPADEEAHLLLAESLADAGDPRAALRELERLELALSHELGVAPSRAVLELRDQLLALASAEPGGSATPDQPELIGRDSEVRLVEQLLAAVGRGEGQTLFVSGDEGLGTTSVLRCLADRASRAGMRVGVGVAAQVEGEWPYAPLLEALSELCRRDPSLLEGLASPLRSEIGDALSGQRTAWDGQGAHQRLFVATAELLRLAAGERGVVLVVDQAENADEATHRLVHYLSRSVVGVPALIALGHRPVEAGSLADLRSSLGSRGRATMLDLAPLGREETVRLASEVAPNADETVLEAIFQKSGGVPFVIVELATAWNVDPDVADPVLRLTSGLSATASRAFGRAAVLGGSFDTDELAALTEIPDAEVFAVIDEGLAHRVIRRTRSGYAFRHPLIREALLTTLGERERRQAHRDAARALEILRRSPAQIGHHLVEAGDTADAVPWMLDAAETEAAHGAYRDALTALEKVEVAAEDTDRARLLELRADLLLACGEVAVVDAYRAALAACDSESRSRLLTRLARAATLTGDLDTAALALSEVELDGSENDVELLLVRGNLAFLQADWTIADEAAGEARSLLTLEGGERWQLFELVALQGLLAHRRGEWFQRLRTELRAGMARPELAVGIFDSHLCVAEYLLYGPTPYDEVLELAEQLRVSAQQAGVLRAVAFATALRGEAALLKGDLELAEHELLESGDLHHDLGSSAGEAHSLQRLAELHLVRGDRETANALLLRALPLARWSPIGNHLLQRIYGSMIEAAPDADAARAVVDRAEATLSSEDDCHFCTIMLDLPAARACIETGDLDRAQSYLASAETSAQLWEGTSWQAALLQVRAHLARAEDRAEEAQQMLAEAARLFEAAGQPLDAARCRSEIDTAA
jgi:DNA-binding SARP family transcriptional activator